MFVESPSFPMVLSLGATGGPGYSTDIVHRSDGVESRNANWRAPLCTWDVGSRHRTRGEVEPLLHFFHAVAQGSEHMWRFRDPTDHTFDTVLGTGDGGTTTYPLVKVYTYGARSVTRRIVKPIPGSVRVWIGGVEQETFTVDTSAGIVTLPTPPAEDQVIRALGMFEVPARFAQDVLPITRVDPTIFSLERIEIMEVRLEAVE